jgi:hypothetical protein
MRFSLPPRAWIVVGAGAILCVVALVLVNPKITAWMEGDGLRALLDRETSKGMKFDAHYGPLQRVGLLGIRTDSFDGTNGTKTIVSLTAHDISGWFNPLGIALRHWEVHAIHIQSGTVMIQKTEATPGAPKGVPPIPWWALFWPYRVEIEDVKIDDGNVLFKLQEKESGIYHTFLEITPNGRDFEYDAKGGLFRTPLTPELKLRHIHLLIRKPRLYCPVFVLGDDDAHPDQQIQVTGHAGLQDDRSIQISTKLQSMEISPWLPEKERDHVLGHISGGLDYHSSGTGLETAEAQGSLASTDAVLHEFSPVTEFIKLTGSPDPGDLQLKVLRSDLRWEQGALTAENIQAECPGVFELHGTVTIAKDKTLTGDLQIGLTDPYLKWLPTAKTAIFTTDDGDYHVTTVHLSGTTSKPVQDLSPRIIHELEKSPGAALKLFFNAL